MRNSTEDEILIDEILIQEVQEVREILSSRLGSPLGRPLSGELIGLRVGRAGRGDLAISDPVGVA